jgi:hypothetical protein
MDLKEKIQADLKEYMKSGKPFETGVLRLIISSFHNREIEKRTKLLKDQTINNPEEAVKLTEEEILEVLSSEAKKRRDSVFEFEKGGRQDLADKEKQELEVLKKYLPEQLSEEEIKKLVKEAIEKLGALGQKDMGKVMAELSPKTKGKADGGLVSRIVKEMLG